MVEILVGPANATLYISGVDVTVALPDGTFQTGLELGITSSNPGVVTKIVDGFLVQIKNPVTPYVVDVGEEQVSILRVSVSRVQPTIDSLGKGLLKVKISLSNSPVSVTLGERVLDFVTDLCFAVSGDDKALDNFIVGMERTVKKESKALVQVFGKGPDVSLFEGFPRMPIDDEGVGDRLYGCAFLVETVTDEKNEWLGKLIDAMSTVLTRMQIAYGVGLEPSCEDLSSTTCYFAGDQPPSGFLGFLEDVERTAGSYPPRSIISRDLQERIETDYGKMCVHCAEFKTEPSQFHPGDTDCICNDCLAIGDQEVQECSSCHGHKLATREYYPECKRKSKRTGKSTDALRKTCLKCAREYSRRVSREAEIVKLGAAERSLLATGKWRYCPECKGIHEATIEFFNPSYSTQSGPGGLSVWCRYCEEKDTSGGKRKQAVTSSRRAHVRIEKDRPKEDAIDIHNLHDVKATSITDPMVAGIESKLAPRVDDLSGVFGGKPKS